MHHTLAWYRNPPRAGQDSLAIAYLQGELESSSARLSDSEPHPATVRTVASSGTAPRQCGLPDMIDRASVLLITVGFDGEKYWQQDPVALDLLSLHEGKGRLPQGLDTSVSFLA